MCESYESPISILYSKIQTQMEDDVVKAVQSYHITVDKDELIKALRYDRDQYEKGYNDCRRSFLLKRGKWISNGLKFPFAYYTCSYCGCNSNLRTDYCSNCGAYMGGDNNE